ATELAEALNEQATANEFIRLQRQRVFQGPVEYLADRIARRYWPGLTRRITTSGPELQRVLSDEKQGASRSKADAFCAVEPKSVDDPSTSDGASDVATQSPAVQACLYLYVPADDATAWQTYEPLKHSSAFLLERVP